MQKAHLAFMSLYRGVSRSWQLYLQLGLNCKKDLHDAWVNIVDFSLNKQYQLAFEFTAVHKVDPAFRASIATILFSSLQILPLRTQLFLFINKLGTLSPLLVCKRSERQSANLSRNAMNDTATDGTVLVPAIARIFKKRVFISRITLNCATITLYRAVTPKLKPLLSVCKLRTQFET